MGLILLTIILQIILFPKNVKDITSKDSIPAIQDNVIIARQNKIIQDISNIKVKLDSLKK